MSHTHLLYHIVFATKDRLPIIADEWRDELHRYLAGTINNLGGTTIVVGGVSDHVHILVRLKPNVALSDFMRELKANSSKWASKTKFPNFAWQARFGAFTVSESQAAKVRAYIQNQEEHHRKKDFAEEYKSLLKAHAVEFDDKHLWS